MKPIIGISTDCNHDPEEPRTRGRLELNWNYAQAIAEAGGVPILIPPMADMASVAKLIDGWLIPGGDDIDAARFGEENHPKVSLSDPARFAGESALLQAIDPELPVLGICYGCQFLNVARGGSLIQHLPDVVGHADHSSGSLHAANVEPESKLYSATGAAEIEGKSYHHQAVGRVGADLRVVARDAEGTVEALEAADRPWMIGVQWHPERTLEDPATRKLFADFVETARQFAANKNAHAAND
ncbi:MAG: gamma-glutamyl-gamma-aminobutyrate hydrolase family protein [Fimbriimonas sp.]